MAADTPPFPTWGSTGAEMAAISAAAGPTAAITAPAATATTATTSTVTIPPSPTSGTKCTLSNPSFQQQQQKQSEQQGAAPEHQPPKRPPIAADRTVFLRQRLGGESLSSGNSSTSTYSDTASDDVTGDWEAGGGRGNTSSRAKSPVAGAGASKATAAGGVGSSSVKKSSRKKRKASGPTSKERRRKSGNHTSASKANVSGSVGGGIGKQNENGRRYVSWDALVKPYKQQWDHIELPSEESDPEATEAAMVGALQTTFDDHGSEGGGESKCGGLCSRFSDQPLPVDPTAFSVEQCSAQAHPTAVASYVLRVRCGGGAHIVRRTWDDLATLCTMLGTTPPPSSDVNTIASRNIRRSDVQGDKTATNPAASTVSAAVAAVAAATVAAVTDSGLGRPAATPNGLEFAPADVLGRNAASGFLQDLLERPGMIWATPTRRFLELEYLDGTLRGGVSDDRREKAARQVASLAASAASPAVFPPTLYQGTQQRQQQQWSSEMDASTTGGFKTAFQGGPVASQCLTVGAPLAPNIWPVAAAAQRSTLIFSAHPDAARDLAAVCRCLGELGATAFNPKALLESAASSSIPSPSSSPAATTTTTSSRGVGDVAPQRVSSMAVLA